MNWLSIAFVVEIINHFQFDTICFVSFKKARFLLWFLLSTSSFCYTIKLKKIKNPLNFVILIKDVKEEYN